MGESRPPWDIFCMSIPLPSSAGISLSGHSIIDSRHFAFANQPRRYRGQVAAKLAKYLRAKRFNDPIEPMTLQNTRENGVRSLAVQCDQCRHEELS
jgi:hypothetical protein